MYHGFKSIKFIFSINIFADNPLSDSKQNKDLNFLEIKVEALKNKSNHCGKIF